MIVWERDETCISTSTLMYHEWPRIFIDSFFVEQTSQLNKKNLEEFEAPDSYQAKTSFDLKGVFQMVGET